MINCEDIQYGKNLDVLIRLPKRLERSIKFIDDKERNIEIIGGFYSLNKKENIIYGNAFLSIYENLNKKIPFINSKYNYKKFLNKFDTKIAEPRKKMLLILDKPKFEIYKYLLKNIAGNNEIYLEDDLMNNVFNPLETQILELLRD